MNGAALVAATLVVVAGLTALVFALAWRQRRLTWLPVELRDARLVYSEREFTTDSPMPLGARVDRAYALPDGTLVLIEFKHRDRPRVFQAGIVQLSVQRVVLERATGAQVATHAYVGLVSAWSGRIRPCRVELESELQVVARYHRAGAVLWRAAPARKTQDLAFCGSCPFLGDCRPELAPNKFVPRPRL
jgi:hypothetical protein